MQEIILAVNREVAQLYAIQNGIIGYTVVTTPHDLYRLPNGSRIIAVDTASWNGHWGRLIERACSNRGLNVEHIERPCDNARALHTHNIEKGRILNMSEKGSSI